MIRSLESLTIKELIDEVRKAEKKAQECEIEGAVYRHSLAECERLAKEAKRTNNPQLLFGVMSQASLALQEKNVKQWAKDWGDVWVSDLSWLRRTLSALKKVRRVATNLDVTDRNQRLKMEIEAVAKKALVQQVPSSITVSQVESEDVEDYRAESD